MLTIDNSKPFLVLDAAMPEVQVALLGASGCLASFRSQDPALESLYQGIEQCLSEAKCELQDVGGFIYCEGPGGTLGLRVIAMTLRAWRALDPWRRLPLFAYHAFDAARFFVQMTTQSDIGNALFLCEVGKDRVYGLKGDAVSAEDVALIALEVIAQYEGEVYWLPQRKTWHTKPKVAHSAHYSIEGLSQFFYDARYLKKVEEPHLLHFENQTFKKWDAKPHTASS